MSQTPCARTQLANVPRTLQQVPTGARTCTTHRQQHGFPQSKRQQHELNHKQTLRQDISRHHRTCYLLQKSEAAAATQMNQHMQQLAQATQQNTHMQNMLQNLTSQVTNLQNQLNNTPQSTQQHLGYQHQAYPAFTPAPATYQQPPSIPYQPNNQAPYQQQPTNHKTIITSNNRTKNHNEMNAAVDKE